MDVTPVTVLTNAEHMPVRLTSIQKQSDKFIKAHQQVSSVILIINKSHATIT